MRLARADTSYAAILAVAVVRVPIHRRSGYRIIPDTKPVR